MGAWDAGGRAGALQVRGRGRGPRPPGRSGGSLRRAAFGPGREAGSRAPAGPRSRCADARSGPGLAADRPRPRLLPAVDPRGGAAAAIGSGVAWAWRAGRRITAGRGREPRGRRLAGAAEGLRRPIGPGLRRDPAGGGSQWRRAAGPGCASTWSHSVLLQAPGGVVGAPGAEPWDGDAGSSLESVW